MEKDGKNRTSGSRATWGYHGLPYFQTCLDALAVFRNAKIYKHLPAKTIRESFSSAIKCSKHSCQNFRPTQNPNSKMSNPCTKHNPLISIAIWIRRNICLLVGGRALPKTLEGILGHGTIVHQHGRQVVAHLAEHYDGQWKEKNGIGDWYYIGIILLYYHQKYNWNTYRYLPLLTNCPSFWESFAFKRSEHVGANLLNGPTIDYDHVPCKSKHPNSWSAVLWVVSSSQVCLTDFPTAMNSCHTRPHWDRRHRRWSLWPPTTSLGRWTSTNRTQRHVISWSLRGANMTHDTWRNEGVITKRYQDYQVVAESRQGQPLKNGSIQSLASK